MINWFGQQDPAVQAAIIAGAASIVVALITGIFKFGVQIEKRKMNHRVLRSIYHNQPQETKTRSLACKIIKEIKYV